ncbi:MAG: hypothetical protein IPG66_05945 [Hydrogenophilales bacterium]|nr:hypothetical protein [Hydrogenophilales bacterium]
MAYTPPTYAHLPNVDWSVSQVVSVPAVRSDNGAAGPAARADLEAVASKPGDVQAIASGGRSPLRALYGEPWVGAQQAKYVVYQGWLVILCIWGYGPIDGVQQLYIGDQPAPAGVLSTHYTGAAGQGIDPTLAAALAAQGVVYTDTLPGLAYSVVRVPKNLVSGVPAVSARIKGLLLYDPRIDATVWSDNPGLALADFDASTRYGMGRDVDWDSAATLADHSDTLVGGERRNTINLVIDQVQESRAWREAIRTYAEAWIHPEGGLDIFVVDGPSDSVLDIDASMMLAGSFKPTRPSRRANSPNAVSVRYTDRSVTPWAEHEATEFAPGVESGAVPRRPSSVSLFGIHRRGQATRAAVQRLNWFHLADLAMEWVGFDYALKLRRGDVVRVSHPYGYTLKRMRIVDISAVAARRWRITVREYDPAMFSDAVASEPTYPDTSLPDPADPPAVTGLTLTEEVYERESGWYDTRIRATWDNPDYPYIEEFRVEMLDGATLIQSGSPTSAEWVSPAVREGRHIRSGWPW